MLVKDVEKIEYWLFERKFSSILKSRMEILGEPRQVSSHRRGPCWRPPYGKHSRLCFNAQRAQETTLQDLSKTFGHHEENKKYFNGLQSTVLALPLGEV